MVELQATQTVEAQTLLAQNLQAVLTITRVLESTYRTVYLFFENGTFNGLPTRNVVFMNIGINLLDISNVEIIEQIKNEIHQAYNQLDISKSYSLLVIPGFLHKHQSIRGWAKIAYDYKVMLITDYRDMQSANELLTQIEKDELGGDYPEYGNIIMTCNYLLARSPYTQIGETEALYITPSGTLAGKIYSNIISQASMGFQYGAMEEVYGVRLELSRMEIGKLESTGLIPIFSGFGKFFPFSGKTLYKGHKVELQSYSIVRTFDWIMKVLMYFMNKQVTASWSKKVE